MSIWLAAEHALKFKGAHMRDTNPLEIAVVAGALMIGILLFVWAVIQSEAVPAEYRSASPGFGWSWDFDYEAGMRDAGRLGEEPWPWPAKMIGNRLVLPVDQPLLAEGLEITYRGMMEADNFRLDIVILSLDASVTYHREIKISEARHSFTLSDRRFKLEHITSRYLLLSSIS
jgi:hypothetical protein